MLAETKSGPKTHFVSSFGAKTVAITKTWLVSMSHNRIIFNHFVSTTVESDLNFAYLGAR